jgi:hypothetical protein
MDRCVVPGGDADGGVAVAMAGLVGVESVGVDPSGTGVDATGAGVAPSRPSVGVRESVGVTGSAGEGVADAVACATRVAGGVAVSAADSVCVVPSLPEARPAERGAKDPPGATGMVVASTGTCTGVGVGESSAESATPGIKVTTKSIVSAAHGPQWIEGRRCLFRSWLLGFERTELCR